VVISNSAKDLIYDILLARCALILSWGFNSFSGSNFWYGLKSPSFLEMGNWT